MGSSTKSLWGSPKEILNVGSSKKLVGVPQGNPKHAELEKRLMGEKRAKGESGEIG